MLDIVQNLAVSVALLAVLKIGIFGTFTRAYLPGVGVNCDQQGSSPRARQFHCTTELLTPAISPNVGNSGAQFLLVGICVRANPFYHLHSS